MTILKSLKSCINLDLTSSGTKLNLYSLCKSLREDRVGYECTSEILVKALLIFSGAGLLATSHMILQRQSKFLPFSLTRSPSSLLKLPFNDYDLPNISSSEAVDHQEASATML